MGVKRPPEEIWRVLRRIAWVRGGKRCVRCLKPQTLQGVHVDHIQSGMMGNNKIKNLRGLCRSCHTLRACNRHDGMIAGALKAGAIPENWRELVWE